MLNIFIDSKGKKCLKVITETATAVSKDVHQIPAPCLYYH